jgi:aryl-phospho-beta-D-glucosidase BglC (GH1 family)
MQMIRLLFLLFLPFNGQCQVAPLSTKSGRIIDAEGNDFIIKGVNWWGANGSQYPYSVNHSKGTDTHAMPFGLHMQEMDSIILAIKTAGFNAVRLPFSNELLHDKTPAQADWIGPNTTLIGLTPLQVLDTIIQKLTEQGIFVILNNHSTTTHWCCNYDFNGLWYGKNLYYDQTPKQWIADWKMMAERYLNNPKVIGMDLRNEVRPLRMQHIPLPKNPNWGRKNKRDWHKYATLAGNAIHEVNPNLLIIVEGINAQVRFLSHLKFPHLSPVHKRPVVLKVPHKLVYEVHNYSFSWSKSNLLFPKRQVKYTDLTSEERKEHYERLWGFVADSTFEYSAPVLLGEFGCSSDGSEVAPWLKDLSEYIQMKRFGFCWWTLEEELFNTGSYGIMNSEMNEVNVKNDWRWEYLAPLMKMK